MFFFHPTRPKHREIKMEKQKKELAQFLVTALGGGGSAKWFSERVCNHCLCQASSMSGIYNLTRFGSPEPVEVQVHI